MENIDEFEMIEKLNPSMFEIIDKWYKGESFYDIFMKSKMYEGSIIRNIKRVYELMK